MLYLKADTEDDSEKIINEKELIDSIWLGMPLQPTVENVEALDLWLLNFASIQVLVNINDWKHRSSCFKRIADCCVATARHIC